SSGSTTPSSTTGSSSSAISASLPISTRPSAGASVSSTSIPPRRDWWKATRSSSSSTRTRRRSEWRGGGGTPAGPADREPPMGSILYMHELPPVGGDTLFASMYAAYEALSQPMKRLLEDCTALHEGEHVYRGRYGVKDEGKVFPKAEHPVIRTHPVSGRK